MGHRIYGCDDRQLICPWNRYANASPARLQPAPNLHRPPLLDLGGWSETKFLKHGRQPHPPHRLSALAPPAWRWPPGSLDRPAARVLAAPATERCLGAAP